MPDFPGIFIVIGIPLCIFYLLNMKFSSRIIAGFLTIGVFLLLVSFYGAWRAGQSEEWLSNILSIFLKGFDFGKLTGKEIYEYIIKKAIDTIRDLLGILVIL